MVRALQPLASVVALATLVFPGAVRGQDEGRSPSSRPGGPLRVLLVTGGHDHDISFYSVFDGDDDLEVRVDGHPSALRGGPTSPGEGTDAMVLYDMPPAMAPEQETALRRWVENGGGVVALHHAIAGRPFVIHDETYKDLWISPRVLVLLRTDNPTSDGPVAWVSSYPKARIVYVQLGHGREAHQNPSFRRLVHNAVRWAAGRPTDR